MKKAISALIIFAMLASVTAVFALTASADSKNLVLGLDDGVEGWGDYTASLTDGKAASSLSFDNEWFDFYYNNTEGVEIEGINAPGGVGTVMFDLGEYCSVNEVRINTFLGYKAGIVAPKSICAYYSLDGVNHTELGSNSFKVPDAESEKPIKWVKLSASEPVVARYIKLEITANGVHTFINEIEVLGEKGATPPETEAPAADDNTETGFVFEWQYIAAIIFMGTCISTIIIALLRKSKRDKEQKQSR